MLTRSCKNTKRRQKKRRGTTESLQSTTLSTKLIILPMDIASKYQLPSGHGQLQGPSQYRGNRTNSALLTQAQTQFLSSSAAFDDLRKAKMDPLGISNAMDLIRAPSGRTAEGVILGLKTREMTFPSRKLFMAKR